MANKMTAVTDIDPKQAENCSSKQDAATSPASDERERHFLDLIENDEVKEALRLRRLENH
jgi:hypothetical protein